MLKRLKAISDLVNNNSYVIDIGCDHALLDIYLIDNKKDIKVIASDINKKALNQGIKNANNRPIDFRLGNGLEVIENETIDTIIIAGSGGIKQIDIIKKDINRLKTIEKIILQPNNEIMRVRKEICKLGFYIDKETLIYEKKHFYTIILFKRGSYKYAYKELYLGPILMHKKDKTYQKWLEYEYKKHMKILPKLGIKDNERKNKIIKQINIIRKKQDDLKN